MKLGPNVLSQIVTNRPQPGNIIDGTEEKLNLKFYLCQKAGLVNAKTKHHASVAENFVNSLSNFIFGVRFFP